MRFQSGTAVFVDGGMVVFLEESDGLTPPCLQERAGVRSLLNSMEGRQRYPLT